MAKRSSSSRSNRSRTPSRPTGGSRSRAVDTTERAAATGADGPGAREAANQPVRAEPPLRLVWPIDSPTERAIERARERTAEQPASLATVAPIRTPPEAAEAPRRESAWMLLARVVGLFVIAPALLNWAIAKLFD